VGREGLLHEAAPVGQRLFDRRIGITRHEDFVNAVKLLVGFWAVVNDPPPAR